MQITLTMGDIQRLAKSYLEELGFSLKDKDITCMLVAARKDPSDSKIIVEVYQGSSVPMKTVVEPILSLEEDTQDDEDTVESSSEDSTQSTNQKTLKSKSIFG